METLVRSLKDDTVRMNDRNKHKETGQMDHQTADPKANASIFSFFPTVHFLKQFLPATQLAHLVLPNTQSRPFAKPKEPLLPILR